MKEYLKLNLSICKNCYKCIRHCPVKAIKFNDNKASIVVDECILCGHCLLICPQGSKEIIDNTGTAKRLISENQHVYASVAPSFVANYPGTTIATIRKALKKLGFYDADETAKGATMVKKQYEQLIRQGEMDVIISSCCPTVNMLIEKYYPEALPYLAPVLSPVQAHAAAIKKADPEARVIFIGPCISKKSEADTYKGYADCVLTFEELSRWLAAENIELETENENNTDSKERLFPTAGGILRTMDKAGSDYSYISVDGIESCIDAIKDIISGGLHKCFIEMSSCKGSCIGGPGMDKKSRLPVKAYMAVNSYAGKNDFPVSQPDADELYKRFHAFDRDLYMPTEEEIHAVLRKLGKTLPEHELNCGTCGYDTCRDKAIAVIRGKADLFMCLPYLMEKAIAFSDNIIQNTPNGILVLNENMEVQRLNISAQRMLRIDRLEDVLNQNVARLLPTEDFHAVLNGGRDYNRRRLYLAEYGIYADMTVIHDRVYNLIIVFMRDVTAEETERERKEKISQQTIETADKVIDNQMRAVQEIASLLGETTAEIKVALTKLKESLHGE
jgi:iron only hydrogenase large subunit-like protein